MKHDTNILDKIKSDLALGDLCAPERKLINNAEYYVETYYINGVNITPNNNAHRTNIRATRRGTSADDINKTYEAHINIGGKAEAITPTLERELFMAMRYAWLKSRTER